MTEYGFVGRARVLVVDSDDSARERLRSLLGGTGYDVAAASPGRTLTAMEGFPPRLVIIGIHGPEGEGIALTSMVKRKGHRSPYVIAVCPDDEGTVQAAYSVGVDDILITPVRPTELVARTHAGLRSWLDTTRNDLLAGQYRRHEQVTQTILSALGEGVLVIDGAGIVEDTNAAMVRIVARPVRDIVGAPIPTHWWAPESRVDVPRRIQTAITAGGDDIHAEILRPDGHRVAVEMVVMPDRGSGDGSHAIVVRDVSAEVRVRQALASARMEQAALRRIARAVAANPDTEAVVSLINQEVADTFSVPCALTLRITDEVISTFGAPSHNSPYEAGRVLSPDFDAAFARVIETGAPSRVAYDYMSLDGPGGVARDAGVVCSVAAPVFTGGELWGVLLISTSHGDGIADERARLQGFAEMVAVALDNAATRQQLDAVTTVDPLTGLANRRAFEQVIARETERARRHGRPLTVVMLDIDRLASVNEAFGHDVGDDAITRFAAILTESCRLTDMVARFGGAEFVCVMPDADAPAGHTFAERVRRAVSSAELPGGLTCSAGVAQWRDVEDSTGLVARAGQALYRAKHEGRDRVSVADNGNVAA